MKKGMIIGKRQMVLAVLVLALGAAVYLNWRFAGAGDELNLTGALSSSSQSPNLGDAKYVNANSGSASGKDSFAAARQSREKARNDAAALLRETLNDPKTDSATKAVVSEKVTALAKNIPTESAIETLMKAKGFSDCVAIITEEKVNIIVAAGKDGLLESQILQIQDIVQGQMQVSLGNINITQVK